MATETTITAPIFALFAWRDIETARWRGFFEANPTALDFAAGDGSMETVRGVVRHIFAVELRYAQRLVGEPATDWADFQQHELNDLFAVGEAARGKIDVYLAGASESSLDGVLTFPTLTAGTISTTRRKLLVQTVTHGVRHWAQITTLVRLGGIRAAWAHDLLAVDVGM